MSSSRRLLKKVFALHARVFVKNIAKRKAKSGSRGFAAYGLKSRRFALCHVSDACEEWMYASDEAKCSYTGASDEGKSSSTDLENLPIVSDLPHP